LKRTIEDSYGHFTLIWKKINDKWLIISDHTSSIK
jgi:ketosteroid isomerase-like protein